MKERHDPKTHSAKVTRLRLKHGRIVIRLYLPVVKEVGNVSMKAFVLRKDFALGSRRVNAVSAKLCSGDG